MKTSSPVFDVGARRRLLGAVVAAAGVYATAAPVQAQQNTEASLDTMTVEAAAVPDSAAGPDSSIVARRTMTGSKTDTEVLDLSNSVSTVTEEEMRTRNVQSLEQAIGYTAGVAVDQYGGDDRYDYFMIRGFDGTSSGTYRDGLSRRTVNFTGGKLEPYGLQRIDILKGSTSTLFGLNAPGGMVNAITKRPLDYDFGEVYTTLGDDHTETAADFGGPIDQAGEWSYRITTKWQDAELSADETRDDRFYFAPALTWKPDDATSLTLLADYNKRRGNTSHAIPIGSNIDPETFLGEPDYNDLDRFERNAGYLFEHDFQNGLTFRQNARYTYLNMDYRHVYLSEPDPRDGRAAFVVAGERDQYAIDNQLQFDHEFEGIRTRTLAGFDYNNDEVDERSRFGTAGGIDPDNPRYCGEACVTLGAPDNFHQKQLSRGTYLQEELTFDDRWIVTLGGRYDEIKTDTADASYSDYAFTKRAGLTWKALENLSFYTNYSESFEPPSSRSLIEGSAEPQEGRQYEIGMKYRPTDNALVTLAAFDLTQENVVKRVTPTLYRQVGEINVRGLELEGKLALNDRLNMTAAYSYWDPEIKEDGLTGNEGNRPMLVPRNIASVWADYTIPGSSTRGDLTLGLGTRFVGDTYIDDENSDKAASYTLVDAMARYDLTENVDLAVNVTNLFDRDYLTYVDNVSNSGFYGNGRSVLTTLRYHW
ncbi:TonB-dependent siderophore receptor [Kushneria marisflavi]|uniref:TonB-dependent siderophore receptor n=1 Tax=Kushneria marisflavi TaxID=157779 RepID=A0A240UPG9_9GAMM|nr:TonB-dependent siderophore receptor [Kushneria marisflavi]ART63384.1 TonB-dependent siderophore receptor [Kushneria marisflavi]RKD84432.1 iron complex outermembrane receptor protein [Kushneria marisflavi]